MVFFSKPPENAEPRGMSKNTVMNVLECQNRGKFTAKSKKIHLYLCRRNVAGKILICIDKKNVKNYHNYNMFNTIK